MTDILTLFDTIAGAIITGICVCRVNAMTRTTNFLIRFTHVLLACGGFALVLAPWFRDADPEWPQTVSHVGLALLLIADRRHCCSTVNRP